MKRKPAGDADLVMIDPQHTPGVRAAERRVTPIIRAWGAYPALTGLSLYWLAVSCYLQGAADGMDVAERIHAGGQE